MNEENNKETNKSIKKDLRIQGRISKIIVGLINVALISTTYQVFFA